MVLRSLRDGVADESLRTAIILGLITVPVTVALSWESVTDEVVSVGGSISGGALLLAGVAVGYHYHGRTTDVKRAGIWAGLAASIGPVVVFGANSVTTIAAASWPWSVVVAGLTPVVVGFGVGLTALVTTVTAVVTDWMLTRLDRDQRVLDPERTGNRDRTGGFSRWRLVVAVYAVLAPIPLVTALGVRPDGAPGWILAGLAVAAVSVLSIVTLVALFVDVTEPREGRWLPNVWVYVAGPIGAFTLGFLFAAVRGWSFPQGYGHFAFLVALWIAATVYLINRRRYDASGHFSGAT